MSQLNVAYTGKVPNIVKINDRLYWFSKICPVTCSVVRLLRNARFVLWSGDFFTLICDLVLGLFSLSRFGVEASRLVLLKYFMIVFPRKINVSFNWSKLIFRCNNCKVNPNFFLLWFCKCSETLKPDLKKNNDSNISRRHFRLEMSGSVLMKEKNIYQN